MSAGSGRLASPGGSPSWHPHLTPTNTSAQTHPHSSFSAQGRARGFPAEAARRAGVSAEGREGQLLEERSRQTWSSSGKRRRLQRRESRAALKVEKERALQLREQLEGGEERRKVPLSTLCVPWGGLRAEEEQESACAQGSQQRRSVWKGVAMLGHCLGPM